MKKLLVGFVFGALLSAVLTYSLVSSDAQVEADAPAISNTESHAAIQTVTTRESGEPAKSRSSTPAAPQEVAANSQGRVNVPPGFSVSSPQAASKATVPVVRPSQSSGTAIPRSTDVVEAIVLLEGHRQVLELDPSFAQQHADLESQVRDDNWSYYMEQMLGGYFVNHAPGTGVEISTIACRSTSCELAAYSEHGTGAFDVILQRAAKESWWDFDRVQGRGSDRNERSTLVLFLERASKSKQGLPQPKMAPDNVLNQPTIARIEGAKQ
jgi:hypothetical protein